MSVMPRACPECGSSGGEPHVQQCSLHSRYEAPAGVPNHKVTVYVAPDPLHIP
jgi:hypothetical protein